MGASIQPIGSQAATGFEAGAALPRADSRTYLARGGADISLSPEAFKEALTSALMELGERRNVLIVAPDGGRADSRAGLMVQAAYELYGNAIERVLIAAGTHKEMSPEKLAAMYPGIPPALFHHHDWQKEAETIDTIDAERVLELTDGSYAKPWPVQLNRLIAKGGHDLILSVGQVVPHEVTGMANHSKNLFVGCGGKGGIDESHFIGAVYGMERMMGSADTPVRRIFNEAQAKFCAHLPIVYALTVVGAAKAGEEQDSHGLATRGIFVGEGTDCFERACALSQQVNIIHVDRPITKAVVYLNPEKYDTTWVGNKAIYRTRLAMAEEGELIVIGPGIKHFGEDAEREGIVDGLIRRYGYRPTDEIVALAAEHEDLAGSLGVAAHLIHGCSRDSRGRGFNVCYCPGGLTREDIETVGFRYADPGEMLSRYPIAAMTPNTWNNVGGEEIFFISDPGLGLWAHESRLGGRKL